MRRKEIYLVLFLLLAVISLFLYMYVFNIYEVDFSVAPGELFADGKSTVRIETIPVNSFGRRAPFRKVSAGFEIVGGKDLITVITKDENEGVLILKAKFTPGEVTVKIKTKKSLLPALVKIPVNPNYTDANIF